MTRPELDQDLLEEYKNLVEKEFRHQMKGKVATEEEKQAFLQKKITKQIKKFSERGKDEGNEALLQQIVRLRQDMFGRGVSALEVLGISSPLRPPPAQRRAHSQPVSSGGVAAIRGSHSHLSFLNHVGNQRRPKQSLTPPGTRSISLQNVEHYSPQRHSATNNKISQSFWGSPVGQKHAHLRDKKWLETEKAGQHATPPPTRDTSAMGGTLDETIEFLPPSPSPTASEEFRRIQQGGGRSLEDSSLDTTIAGELASFDLTYASLEDPGEVGEHTRIHKGNVRIPDISLETTVGGEELSAVQEESETFDQPVGMHQLYPPKHEITFDKPAGMDKVYPEEETFTQDIPQVDETFTEIERQPDPDPDLAQTIMGLRAVEEEAVATDVVRRQVSAHRKLHTHPATGEPIPDAPPDALPISQPAYQETLRLERHPPATGRQLPRPQIPAPTPPRRKVDPPDPDPNVTRVVGEDLHRSRIIGRGEPRAQTQYLATPYGTITEAALGQEKSFERSKGYQPPFRFKGVPAVETPEMMQQKPAVTEAGAALRPPTPPRFDARGKQVGFESEMAFGPDKGGRQKPIFEPLAHKPAPPERFESVGTAEYSGGNQTVIHADEPHSSLITRPISPRRRGPTKQEKTGKGPPSWGEGPNPQGGGDDEFPERDKTWRERIEGDGYGFGGGGGGPDDSPDDSGSGSGRGPIRSPRKPGRGRGRVRPALRRRAAPRVAAIAERRREPLVVHTQQPAIIPVIPQGVGGVASKEKSGINIKITTKSQAIVNEKKKRRKVTTARKEYSKLRRETIKAIRKGKAQHYKAESAKLKSLPVKKRKAARDSLKKKLRLREVRLIGQLPGASKMSVKDLDRVTRIARKLRW